MCNQLKLIYCYRDSCLSNIIIIIIETFVTHLLQLKKVMYSD